MKNMAFAAVLLPISTTTPTGRYDNDLALLTDGSYPTDGAQWRTDTVWWSGTGRRLEFDQAASIWSGM